MYTYRSPVWGKETKKPCDNDRSTESYNTNEQEFWSYAPNQLGLQVSIYLKNIFGALDGGWAANINTIVSDETGATELG